MTNEQIKNCIAEYLSDYEELLETLPWHVGFHNQIADIFSPTGDFHTDMVRYSVVQVCDHDGRHVCWAKSPEHAAIIVESVNKLFG